MADDKFIVTSLKDSKKINRVLANDTAREIMELLAERRMTATQIAEKMQLPLTTVDYSLKNLESVGLIKTKTGFNKNTRVVKYYEPQEKFIVIAPKQTQNTLSILKSLIPLFFLIGVLTFAFESVRIPTYTETYAPTEKSAIPVAHGPGVASDQRIAQESTTSEMPLMQEEITRVETEINPHYGLMFLILSSAGILLYVLWKKGLLRKFS